MNNSISFCFWCRLCIVYALLRHTAASTAAAQNSAICTSSNAKLSMVSNGIAYHNCTSVYYLEITLGLKTGGLVWDKEIQPIDLSFDIVTY